MMAPYSGSGGVRKVVHVGDQVKRRVMARLGVNGLRGYHRRHSLQIHSDLVPSLVKSALKKKNCYFWVSMWSVWSLSDV